MEKEIIGFDEQHGFVFNMRSVYFLSDVCEDMLSEELNANSQRELVHAAWICQFNENLKLTAKTNYGHCDVTFDKSIMQIESYQSRIMEKLISHVTLEDFTAYTEIIERVLNLSDQEKLFTREVINTQLAEELNIEDYVPQSPEQSKSDVI